MLAQLRTLRRSARPSPCKQGRKRVQPSQPLPTTLEGHRRRPSDWKSITFLADLAARSLTLQDAIGGPPDRSSTRSYGWNGRDRAEYLHQLWAELHIVDHDPARGQPIGRENSGCRRALRRILPVPMPNCPPRHDGAATVPWPGSDHPLTCREAGRRGVDHSVWSGITTRPSGR